MSITALALLSMFLFTGHDDIPQSRVNTLNTCAVYFVPFHSDSATLFRKLRQLGLKRTSWDMHDSTDGSDTYTWLQAPFMYGFRLMKGRYVGADVSYYSPHITDRTAWFRRHAKAYSLAIDDASDVHIGTYHCADGSVRFIGIRYVPDDGVLISVIDERPDKRRKR